MLKKFYFEFSLENKIILKIGLWKKLNDHTYQLKTSTKVPHYPTDMYSFIRLDNFEKVEKSWVNGLFFQRDDAYPSQCIPYSTQKFYNKVVRYGYYGYNINNDYQQTFLLNNKRYYFCHSIVIHENIQDLG